MKRTMAVVIVIGILATGAMGEAHMEMLFRMQGHMPNEQLDWDSGSTFEFQARFWASEEIGTALSMGLGSWTTRSEYSEEDDGTDYMAMSVYGSVSTLPIGMSALYRNRVSDDVSILFEAGLRYVMIGSDITVEIGTDDGVDAAYYKELVEIDDTFLAVLGISIETEIDDGIAIEFGMGYQLDLMKPHEYFLGEDAGATSFEAATVNLGFTWEY